MTTLVGAGYRQELSPIFEEEGTVQVVELLLDRYGDSADSFRRAWDLGAVIGRHPVVLHGVSGNLASVVGPKASYLDLVCARVQSTGALVYSDHLAMTHTSSHGLGHLAPNRFDQHLLDRTVGHIERFVDVLAPLGCPLLLENLAYEVRLPGSSWTAEEFTLRLLDATPSWSLLLDVTNVWVNAKNFGFDPHDFVVALPPSRVAAMHLAGPEKFGLQWIDTHGAAVQDEIFDLLAFTMDQPGIEPTALVVERDGNFRGAIPEVREELRRCRSILANRHSVRAQVDPTPAASPPA